MCPSRSTGSSTSTSSRSGRTGTSPSGASFGPTSTPPNWPGRSCTGGRPVLFDGNFYYEAQLDDLVGRLRFRHYIFRLDAPLAVCIARDGHRRPPHGAQAAQEVYAKAATVGRGIGIDATVPVDTMVDEIVSHLPRT